MVSDRSTHLSASSKIELSSFYIFGELYEVLPHEPDAYVVRLPVLPFYEVYEVLPGHITVSRYGRLGRSRFPMQLVQLCMCKPGELPTSVHSNKLNHALA